MQAFRDMVRGWLGKVLLGLIVVLMALLGIESYFAGGGTPVVAKVNGEKIYQTELDRTVESQRQQLLASMGANADSSAIDNRKLQASVLNDIIRRQLLIQQAGKDGFLISDATIGRLIQENPAFQVDGKFSPQRYTEVLGQLGENPSTFPARAKQTIAVSQLVSGLGKSGFLTTGEVEYLSALDNQKRDVHVATISSAAFLADAKVSQDDIKKFYDANTKRFTTEEKVSIEYISLSQADFLAQADISDEQLQARYAERVRSVADNEQRHAAHILININDKVKDADALKRIQEVEKRLKAGEDFGALAKEFSEDTGSVASGGDLGFAGHGQFVPAFEKALFSMTPGSVSAPVKTEYGYHLIKLLEIQKPDVPSFAALRPELEKEAREAKAEELFTAAGEKLDAASYEAADLAEPAAAYKLAIHTSEPFGRKGGAGFTADRKIVSAAFSDDVLKDGKNSQGIHLDDGRAVWLRVKTHDAEKVRPLAEVTAEIRSQLALEQASAKAGQLAESASAELAAGRSLAEVAAASKLHWMDTLSADRRTPTLSPELSRAAFRVSSPAAGKLSATAVKVGNDYAVVAVSRVEQGKSTLAGLELAQMTSVLGDSRGQQEFEDYLEYLKGRAKISISLSGKTADE